MANKMQTNAMEAAQLIRDTAANTAMALDIAYIKADLAEIKVNLDNKYVTKEEFQTVKALVYGFAGLILTSVVLALVYLVIKQ